ncbi:hypothetical protein [Haloferula sp. A504]|uniref:hypothetical protein n=1 Tax=Haloferula sp. A504 TaxID=3373601 RepID=UPI0031C90503|nr:hypothetical protein [Verrucomicrobiaceae bacterium E54]
MSSGPTIETKIQFRRVRDGCKKLEEAPATPPPEPPKPVPREARLMALAIHFDRLIREGAVESYSEIARLTGACPAWITEIMKLADLPVPEQEALLVEGLDRGSNPGSAPVHTAHHDLAAPSDALAKVAFKPRSEE